MIREEIIAKWDGMNPRDRDAWVAEVVIRTTVYRDIMGDVYDNCTGLPLPEYTTEISAAWTVLNEFDDINIRRYVTAANEYMYVCKIEDDERKFYAEVYAKTAPEAMSLAGIIAKLTEVRG